MEFTKGKWLIRKHGLTYIVYLIREGGGYYEVARGIYSKTNASLIAAAPKLYETIESAIKTLASRGENSDVEFDLGQALTELKSLA